MTHDTTHLSSDSSGGLERRTLVAGAAWTIPVIATAVGAPLAAASTGATLAFINGPYSVAACGTLKDVVLRATTDGTTSAPAGTLVTVTLPEGLAWSDRSTGSKPFSTDGNGEVVLVGVKAARAPIGTRSLGASSGTTTASATVTVDGTAGGWYSYAGQVNPAPNYPNVPAGSTAVGARAYLSPDRTLYGDGRVIATGVTSAQAEFVGNDPTITFVGGGVC